MDSFEVKTLRKKHAAETERPRAVFLARSLRANLYEQLPKLSPKAWSASLDFAGALLGVPS